MFAYSLVVLFCLGFVLPSLSLDLRNNSFPVGNFSVDLDLPPQKRWSQIIPLYQEPLMKIINNIILPGGNVIPEKIQEEIMHKSNFIGENLEEMMGQYGLEMQGIAETLNVSNGAIVSLNLIYELTFACTSIVAVDINGKMLHGRNQDFGNVLGLGTDFTNVLRQMVIAVNFTSKGELQYSGNTYAGYVGLPTGEKRGFWSISMDAYMSVKASPWQELLNILNGLLNPDVTLTTILARDTLYTTEQYDDAVQILSTRDMVAPVYFIMAGNQPEQGIVITRLRNKCQDIWDLANTTSWFLVETNYNHWERNPPSDPRRQIANNCMKSVGQENINQETLYGCLSQPGVLNIFTTYTAIMVPSTGEYNTAMRECCF